MIGGSFAPIIASALYARYHSNLSISLYMTLASIISLTCVTAIAKVHATDLARTPHPREKSDSSSD